MSRKGASRQAGRQAKRKAGTKASREEGKQSDIYIPCISSIFENPRLVVYHLQGVYAY